MPATKPRRHAPPSRPLFALAASLILGCGGQPAAPSDPADQPPEGVAVAEVLERLAAAYREADSYYDNAEYRESFMKRNENRLIEPPPHQVSIAFERPNRFRITRRVPEVDGPELVVVVASDGDELVATISDLPGQRLEKPAPSAPLSGAALAPDPALRGALLPVPLENLFPQLDLLIATDDRPPRLLADADARLLANREIDGRVCHRVELTRPAGKYVLWVDAETSTLRRVGVPTAELKAQLDPDGAMLDWQLWIDLRDATLGGALAPSVFRPEPPEGAEPVEAFDANEQPSP